MASASGVGIPPFFPTRPGAFLCAAVAGAFLAALCCLAAPSPSRAQTSAENPPAVSGNSPAAPSLGTMLAGRRFSASRPFGGSVDVASAREVARADAWNTALQSILRPLASLPDVRFAGSLPNAWQPDILALARACVSTRPLLESVSRRDSILTATIELAAPPVGRSLEKCISDTLVQHERLELYGLAAAQERAQVQEYDAALAADRAGALPETGERARAAVRSLRALRLYADALASFSGIWNDPSASRDVFLEALDIAPQTPLILNALGDATLQLGRSQEAVELQTRALVLNPSFARAYHSRGLANLALNLPFVAERDLTQAVSLAPARAAYVRDRGVARLLRENIPGMCEDFYAACVLGDCVKLHWAVEHKRCSPQALRGQTENASQTPQ